MPINISGRMVGPGYPCLVIAEIGINHNGDINIAKRLIDAAKEAGCEAVKFQKRTIELCYTEEELAQPRTVSPASGVLQLAVKRGVLSDKAVRRLLASDYENSTNGDLKYALEFTEEEYEEIDCYCREKGVIWFASPWDERAVDFLERFHLPCYKVASTRARGEDGLLRYLKSKGRPIIISTGACEEVHIRHAVELLGPEDLLIMHCVATYPVKNENLAVLNLRMIETLGKWFPEVPIGYSGHEVAEPTSVMAAVLGACAIERHITLDRAMFGSDQAASMEPGGVRLLVRDIRIWETARGDGIKRIIPGELEVLEKLRRKNIPV